MGADDKNENTGTKNKETKPAADAVADDKNENTDTKPATDAVDDSKATDGTKESSDKNIGNPITPVPNVEKDCDASPPKLKNKTIKRKLKVLDTDTVSPMDESQPEKIMKVEKAIKTV